MMCGHANRVWLPRRCRQCGGCRTARRFKALARIHAGLDEAADVAFLTLTTTPGADWPKTMRRWQQMVRWLRRASPQLEYVAVKELGGRHGMLHLHILLTGYRFTAQPRISAEWRRLTGAWVVNVQRVRTDQAASYVAKYIGKGDAVAKKTVTYSSKWPKLPPSSVHLVPLRELGPEGPTTVRLSTSKGGFVEAYEETCDCFGTVRPTSIGEHLWLKSLPGRSPPGFLANSAQ